MFTGLVEETGVIRSVRHAGTSLHVAVGARKVLEGSRLGDSICVNGVCLTVVGHDAGGFTVDVMPETFHRTGLKDLPVGAPVNLERAMAAGGRFGGHIVQGHVDGVGRIRSLEREEIAVWVTVQTDPEILQYVVPKGSITVDGISLTVVDVGPDWLRVSLIPHTWASTNMKWRGPGDPVNLEVDILAKYVERMLAGRFGGTGLGARPRSGGLTEAFLREHGYDGEGG